MQSGNGEGVGAERQEISWRRRAINRRQRGQEQSGRSHAEPAGARSHRERRGHAAGADAGRSRNGAYRTLPPRRPMNGPHSRPAILIVASVLPRNGGAPAGSPSGRPAACTRRPVCPRALACAHAGRPAKGERWQRPSGGTRDGAAWGRLPPPGRAGRNRGWRCPAQPPHDPHRQGERGCLGWPKGRPWEGILTGNPKSSKTPAPLHAGHPPSPPRGTPPRPRRGEGRPLPATERNAPHAKARTPWEGQNKQTDGRRGKKKK